MGRAHVWSQLKKMTRLFVRTWRMRMPTGAGLRIDVLCVSMLARIIDRDAHSRYTRLPERVVR